MLTSQQLYEKIEKLRKENGLTTNKLSELAGISHSTLNSWKIRGTMPKLEVLDGLCYALGISLSVLLFDIDADKLTGEEIELLTLWKNLDNIQKKAVITMIKAMEQKT